MDSAAHSVSASFDNGSAAILQRSVEETCAGLGQDGPAYAHVVTPLAQRWQELASEILQPVLHIPSSPLLLGRFGWRAWQPAAILARRLFRTPAAQALFGGLAAHSMLPLDALGSAAFGWALAIAAHAVGWPIPRGGSQRIADALASYFTSLGGKIVTGARIRSLDEVPVARSWCFAISRPGSFLKSRGNGFRDGSGIGCSDIAMARGLQDRLGAEPAAPWKAPECVEFPNGLEGIALNLEEDNVGAVILGPDEEIREGTTVKRTNRIVEVPVGPSCSAALSTPLGDPLDGKGPIDYQRDRLRSRARAPAVVDRQPVKQPLQTGLKAINSLIPIGRGQRELIIGDRGTGKTAIAIDTIINQKGQEALRLFCIYVAIGQKNSTSSATCCATLEAAGAMEYTIIVAAAAAGTRRRCSTSPRTPAARWANSSRESGKDALIVYDDLSKHAVGLPPGLAAAAPSAGPRSLSGRRVLSPLPPAGAAAKLSTARLPDRAADHRDPRGRRLGLHPDERHLDHRRPDLPGDRPLQPGHPPRRLASASPSPASVRPPRSRRRSRSRGS